MENSSKPTGELNEALAKPPNFRVDGKRALVTGGSRGIGFASAVALAQAGAHVTLAARSRSDLDEACSAIRSGGWQCDGAVLDVTDPRAARELVNSRHPFDILVNSAGTNRPKHLVDLTDEDIDTVFDLNVKATFYVTRAVVARLVEAGRPGSIINVSSQMGLVGSPRRTLYSASKHALEGFTKSLAWELGEQRIRVNTLCPTFIETTFTAQMFKEPAFREWVTSRIALGRLGRVEEVMGAVIFLASDASSLMTGSALVIDGGWTAV